MATALPQQLRYLEPAFRQLANFPADQLNEDADVSMLEEALRDRLRGLNIRQA